MTRPRWLEIIFLTLIHTWLLARPVALFSWKLTMVWNAPEVVKTYCGTQHRLLHVLYISLSLFLSWHLNLPLLRELAGRTRASESAQYWIRTLSWINSIISNISFPQPKSTLKWNRGWFLICRSIVRMKWNNMCLSIVSVLFSSYHTYFSLSELLGIICC